ncbi:hypothetical protein BDD12DRAFT_845513 [Trichophaea hybrida]|nr:hypothetical protein BDD12DRAFT_845513 [Trichophaea hybrida]
MASLSTLPTELHLCIVSHLSESWLSRYSLSLTNHYFNALIGPLKPSKVDIYRFRIEVEKSDGARYHRVCSKCSRLRQFYHFSLYKTVHGVVTHVSPDRRYMHRWQAKWCLDCRFNKDRLHVYLYGQGPFWWFFKTMTGVCRNCRQLVRCRTATIFDPANQHYVPWPHICKIGKEPEPLGEGGPLPSVSQLRAALDRLEATLPPRYLLAFRPDEHEPRHSIDEVLAYAEKRSREISDQFEK